MKKLLLLENKFLSLRGFAILGILMWFGVFLITPAYPTIQLSSYTIFYIIACYAFFFIGYSLPLKNKFRIDSKRIMNEKLILFIILLLTVSWVFRYVDLFFFRDLSLFNTVKENRTLLAKGKNNMFFIVFSIIKEAYYLPLLLTLLYFKKSKKLIILSSVVFTYPLIEPFLRGTRKDIFMLLIYLFIVLIVTRTLKTNKKTILKIGVVMLLANIVFFHILMKRESSKLKSDNVLIEILDNARYNELLMPNEAFKKEIKASTGIKQSILFNYLHTTQYYTHGVFELDYLIKKKREKPEQLNGAYTFYNVPRFTNLVGLTNYDIDSVHKASPRSYTYITFFGGLYIDFAWGALMIMLLIGIIQKRIDYLLNKGKGYIFYFYIFFCLFNILMPVINIIRGSGLYTLISGLILLLLVPIIIQRNEKSLST